jgi:oxygen-independent coproporphyrinogen-3 oxidase
MSLGIYIQVPFCQTKCTYCNFHTGVASPAAYAPYARAVEREILNWRAFFVRQKPRDSFVNARELLMSMTLARRALLPPDNPGDGLLGGLPSVSNLTGGLHKGLGSGAGFAASCHPEGVRDRESKLPQGASTSTETRATEGSALDFSVPPGFSPVSDPLAPIGQPITDVVEREKGSSRQSHGHQELSRFNKVIKPFFALKNDTIYLGGGTPSLFDPVDLTRILAAVRSQFSESDAGAPSNDERRHHEETRSHVPMRASDEGSAFPDPRPSAGRTGPGGSYIEITLEADPETITPEKAAAWLAAGINRISMGAQSFHDTELKAAGRMHRRADIFSAIAHLRAAGFANISLDLIAGLPHQTAASWQASVDEALRLRPEHISIYLFEIDEGSRLGRELLSGGSRYSSAAVPGDDAMAESYEFACERLREAGYEHYEISNWALPGFRSRHNLKYWRREPYLGFGAGAHSFDGRWRWANAHDPAAYAEAIADGRLPIEQLEEITPKQALDEELFLGLRQLEGIDLARIAAEYGSQYGATLGARIEELRVQGLVERDGTRVRLAPARLAVSNEVFVALLD